MDAVRKASILLNRSHYYATSYCNRYHFQRRNNEGRKKYLQKKICSCFSSEAILYCQCGFNKARQILCINPGYPFFR